MPECPFSDGFVVQPCQDDYRSVVHVPAQLSHNVHALIVGKGQIGQDGVDWPTGQLRQSRIEPVRPLHGDRPTALP